jgi:hypothetical protein
VGQLLADAVLLGFVGGCSGSTAGGIKIFRFQVAYILLKANLNQLIHPRAVIKQKYNGHRLDEEIVRSILTFSFFFAITICVIALLLSLLGVDWMTALTGAASTVSGVGPGLGEPSARPATSPRCRMRQVDPVVRHAARPTGDHYGAGVVHSGVLASLTGGQARPVLAGRGVEPAAERAEEVARVGKPQQVGNFQQGHARLRQVLLGQFAAGVVEQGLETGALLLQPPLQGALRQVQGLGHGIALGLALRQHAAQHLAHRWVTRLSEKRARYSPAKRSCNSAMASLAVGSGASMSARSNTSASYGAPNTSGAWNATLYGSIFFGCGPESAPAAAASAAR